VREFIVTELAAACDRLFEGGRKHERELCVNFLREMAELAPEEGIFPKSAERHIIRAIESLAESIEALEHLDEEEDERETMQ
jgi:hypothetical protein